MHENKILEFFESFFRVVEELRVAVIVMKEMHESVLLNCLQIFIDEQFVDTMSTHSVRTISPKNVK